MNAILRKASKEPAFLGDSRADALATLVSKELPLAEQLGIRFSHPTWMVGRWIRTYGEERTRNLLEANNCAPALSGYLLDPQHAEEATLSLQQTGTRISPGNSCEIHGFSMAATPAREKRYGKVGSRSRTRPHRPWRIS